MTAILYENGIFWVTKAAKGKGFEVYQSGATHSTRCAIIGFEGSPGLGRAIAECDRRAALAKTSNVTEP